MMDLNNIYWNETTGQQNQTFVVPILPSTSAIYYPSTAAVVEHINPNISKQYNSINTSLYQPTISLHPSHQQVRENILSNSNDFEIKNSSIDTSIKTDQNYKQQDILLSSQSKKLKKVSNELKFSENEKSNTICGLNEEISDNDQTYLNSNSGVLSKKREIKLGPTCRQEFCRNSKFRFCSNFDEETRQRIFDEFWNILNCDQRHIYVATRVFQKPINRSKSDKASRRRYTLIYTLRNSSGNSEQVCRHMFLNTLSITEKQVTLWVKKYSIGGDGVSQTKLAMLKSMQPKLNDGKCNNSNKKIKNASNKKIIVSENKPDQFLSHLLNCDIKKISNVNENIESNCVKGDSFSSLDIPNKSKRKRNDSISPDKQKRKRSLVSTPEYWKRNVNKCLRLEGKAYKSCQKTKCNNETLIERKAKELLPTCNSPQCNTSKLRHCSTISEWRREEIFKDFWNKWDWNQKKIFVASMVIRKETHRKKIKNNFTSRRQATLVYNLPNDNGIPVQVCQYMFVNTIAISKSQVSRWIRKYSLGSKIEEKIILYKDATTHASEWLDKLPKIKTVVNGEEIYYFDPEFKSFINFYHTYCDVYEKEHGSKDSVMKKYVFSKMCRIKKLFLMPQNELVENNCTICKEIKNNNNNIDNNYEQHKMKKDKALMEKLKDKKLAKSNRAIVLLVHLQPIKCVPILRNPITLYKSKLSCFNFTIYNLKTDFSHCYWFSEDQCGELDNSIESVFTSIICDHIKNNCLINKLPIVIYSDGQIEQTRNYILSNALLNLSILNGIQILQKFSETGHSLVDNCFKINATFDKYIYVKKKEIFLPSQLAKSIREIKRSPKLSSGIHLDYDFFCDYSKSEFLCYDTIKPSRDHSLTETLNEKDICAIKYDTDGKIRIKMYFEDEWIELLQKVHVIKPVLEYPKLYSDMAKIAKTKWDDLQDLKLLIPFDCQPFYDSIKYYED